MATPESTDASPAPRSLRHGVIWTIFGNFGFAGSQWLTLALLAKITQPELVGRYALALSLTAPIMLLANLNLRAVQSTDVRDNYAFGAYLQLRFVTTAIALVVCIVIAILVGQSASVAAVIGFVAVAKAAESMSDAYYGRWQKYEQMDSIARSMLMRGGGALGSMTLVTWLTGSLVLGTAAMALSWVVVLIAYDVRAAQGEPSGSRGWVSRWNHDDRSRLVRLAWLALPLGIVQMLIALNINIPRYVIQAVSGERDLGIFAAIAYVAVAGSTFVAAVGQAVSPRLAHLHSAGDRRGFVSLLAKLTLLFAICFVVAMSLVLIAGKPIVSILYTPEYAEHASLLVIFTLSFGVGAIVSVCGFGLTAAQYFRSQVPLVALAVVTTTGASLVLIPAKGIVGAAWAVFASLVVWAIASCWVLWLVLREFPQPTAVDITDSRLPVDGGIIESGYRRPPPRDERVEKSPISPRPVHTAPVIQRPLRVPDPVSATRWLFVLLCVYLASQAYTVPLVPIGPWPVWPGLPDLAFGALVIAWLPLEKNISSLSGIRRTAARAILGLVVVAFLSYAINTVLTRNLETVSFGINQQGPAFGLFEVVRFVQFLILFRIALCIPYTTHRLHIMRQVVTITLIVACVTVIVTFQNMIPSSSFVPFLPQGQTEAGAWWYYIHNYDGFGLGTISYTHAYVAAQLTLLLGLTLFLRGNRATMFDGALIGLALVAAMVSGSRAGFAGILVIAAVFLLTRSPQWVMQLVLGLALVAAVLTVYIVSLPPTDELGSAVTSIVQHQAEVAQPYKESNLVGRSEIWSGRIDNLNEHPWRWFIGWGVGSSPDTGPGLSPHMLPLQIIMELGIVTLAVIGVIGVRFLKAIWRREGGERYFFWATIALVLSSATQETFYPVPSTGYFLGFYLVVVAIVLRPELDRTEDPAAIRAKEPVRSMRSTLAHA